MPSATLLFCLLLTVLLYAVPTAVATPSSGSPPAAVKQDILPYNPHDLYPSSGVSLSTRWLSQPEERIMTLTFDDGPEERDLAIAALLKQYHAPATFFFLGHKVEARPEVVESLLSDNYEIGYHSYRHQRLSLFSQNRLSEDFRQGVAAFNGLGILVTWFRPPYGEFNREIVQTAKTQGMETILWTIDSRDWTGVGPVTLARDVIRRFHPGAILLFHSNQAVSLQALPTILEAAIQKGYRLVSLTEWRTMIQTAQRRMEAKNLKTPQPCTIQQVPEHPTLSECK